MRNLNQIIFSIFLFLFSFNSFGQSKPIIMHQNINQTNINVEGTPVVLAQIDINVPSDGKVIVRFDGQCYTSPGDRIVLAASNDPTWHVNDGNVGVEAIDNDIRSKSFSHTRVYHVNSGNHTFYAIAQNYVETDGDGIASFYANLTATYIPNVGTQYLVKHQGINQTNINVEGSPVVLSQVDINAPTSGKIIVRFDGNCISTSGDRIVLAASNDATWHVNDGNTSFESINSDLNRNSFSHTRIYDVGIGNHSLYAIAENYVENDGDGIISIYGNLTAEFIPNDNDQVILMNDNISQSNIDVEGSPVVFGQQTLSVPAAGKVVVHFDGTCVSTTGDRIVLAASNDLFWHVNDGNVSCEAYSSDINHNSFSHTRVYDVNPGEHTFYAVAENYVENDGNGIASIYGNLTIQFITNELVNGTVDYTWLEKSIEIFPNPTSGFVNINLTKELESKFTQVSLLTNNGNVLSTKQINKNNTQFSFDLSKHAPSQYFIQFQNQDNTLLITKPVAKL